MRLRFRNSTGSSPRIPSFGRTCWWFVAVPRERHLETAPTLVAEILSPSTAENGRTFKRRLYHQQRVATYLIIDGEAGTVTIDRTATESDGETQTETAGETITLTLCKGCEIRLITSTLFG